MKGLNAAWYLGISTLKQKEMTTEVDGLCCFWVLWLWKGFQSPSSKHLTESENFLESGKRCGKRKNRNWYIFIQIKQI